MPCDYEGDSLTYAERERYRVDHGKAWRVCLNMAMPLGSPVVCSCTGCGDGCKGYSVRQTYLDKLKEHLAHPGDYPGGSGRGIVTVGGGFYWPGIVVMIRLARELGITLPIEVWHRGELEPVNPADVAGLEGITFHDSEAMGNKLRDWRIGFMPPKDQGWANKLYALSHTQLETVFFVDADAYFVGDPAPLFEFAEQERFVFWTDLPNQVNAIRWPEVWPEGANGVPQIQGGQLVIHRPSFWKELSTANWMCQQAEFYFPRMFGDQDTWRVALSATKGSYRNLGPAPLPLTGIFVCPFDGSPLIVHRCQAKLTSQSSPIGSLPREGQVFRILREHFAAKKIS
jgi:hypothetical protein